MYLKKLELSGFKSFAKSTVLEFPSTITAIVGPNGSGKSNIKDAIQWVLGEQSMKSLRGKKGEDLIWNGSPEFPRMGKASVTLLFDNRDGRIPIEFEEVSLARKIFRDGLNEYGINDSQVRLKDVVELLARIGLGQTQHNIIGQGEVDRMLLAAPRDRREMLEEALGLRVYQLKKREAERKLEATENNMRQVEALIREISPHLKFLRVQAEKAKTKVGLEGELLQLEKIYAAREGEEIAAAKEKIEASRAPLLVKERDIKKEIARLERQIAIEEQALAGAGGEDESRVTMEFEEKRRMLEHELGRLEGKLEAEHARAQESLVKVVDVRYIKEEVEEILQEIRAILEEEGRIEIIRSQLLVLVEDVERLLQEIVRGKVEERREENSSGPIQELKEKIHALHEEIENLTQKIREREVADREAREKDRALQRTIREWDVALRARQDEAGEVALLLQRINFEEERLKVRMEALQREVAHAGIDAAYSVALPMDGYRGVPVEEVRRKIERARIRLEEVGGIDELVLTEYEEVEARHSFLTKELDDVRSAHRSLKELAKDLDQHVKKDFREGFGKIKEEFHNYFRVIFGGGSAKLQIVSERPAAETLEEGDDVGEHSLREEGIEVSVDLPRKRIRGLAMLSGGERALTAIALLFAIAAVSPPPFLVLDETDAALDEANSQRYAAILKELAKKTQLILVTHNRETMKAAGALYGVTMGDAGVSRLLSLKLEEAEEYTNR